MSKAQKKYNASLSYEERVLNRQSFIKAGKEAAGQIIIDTRIELFVVAFLSKASIEFEHPYQAGPFNVDFYIPAINTILEVNGCYWHGCEQCGFNDEKARERRLGDKRRYGALAKQGYKIRKVWEHEIKQRDMDSLIRIVELVKAVE